MVKKVALFILALSLALPTKCWCNLDDIDLLLNEMGLESVNDGLSIDDLIGQLDDITDEPTNISPLPEDSLKDDAGFWENVQFFYNLPCSVKIQMFKTFANKKARETKEHLDEHKKKYISLFLLISAIILCYKYKRRA